MSIFVKAHIGKGLKANEWAAVVGNTVGGKSGGKDESAQGAGSDVSSVEKALSLAEAHAKKFL